MGEIIFLCFQIYAYEGIVVFPQAYNPYFFSYSSLYELQ